jgi:hypothetical protein
LAALSGCSFVFGTPASHGWPSSNPDDYAYVTGPTCHVYRKTTHVDAIVTLVGTVVSITGLVLRADDAAIGAPLAVVGATVALPFFASDVVGSIGRSRCHRWGREIPLGP